ncbi:sterol uptake control 2 [Fusarium napiforme]|uniref:Sterol uptake control 2 n=1 Tax=Fusarium napiforme TaxID=42672 RepID=A0A8H5NA13_9HYPO|nr:sterol uptake control 2 [Fusarium napiforme]
MDNAPSASEARIMHVHGDLAQAINDRLPSDGPSLRQSLPGDTADVSTSTSSSSPSSLLIGRPRRRPIPRKGHTKSRRGCFHCKRRRVKCQETTPSCDNCDRLGLQCEYPQTSAKGLMTLPSPQPAQPLSQAQLSMLDLRFFHHFLLHAYPGLPIQGEEVWKEVAKYSHGFDFLAHAMLAVGASHLGLCNGTDYNSDAISHRVKAIKSLNSALDTPCQNKEEGDARYATLMALTWQSSYMPDGMQEFLSMLRGCTIVSKCSVFQFEDSAFRMFTTEGHVQRVEDINNGGFDIGLPDGEAIDAGIASLKAIAPLSKSMLEISLVAALKSILEMSRTTCVGAFGDVCRAYQLFGGASDSDFLTISDSDNDVAQIIMAHFFAIEYVLASIALAPVSPSFPFRKTIITAWILRTKRQVPSRYGAYIEWPLGFVLKANSN